MTCSARLPVYVLVIAAFLPEKPLLGPLLGTRAAAMIGLYLLGFGAALATARLLKSTLLKRESPLPFILELLPTAGRPCSPSACGWSTVRSSSSSGPAP